MPAAPPSYDDSMAAGGAGGFAPPPPPGQVEHLTNFLLSLFFCCLFSKLCSQMYPGLPGKEGAPPPPASYPAPQVCERTFMLLRKLLLLLLLVCLKIFVSMEKKNVNDKLCSPAAPGSSPGGDSGKSRSSNRA